MRLTKILGVKGSEYVVWRTEASYSIRFAKSVFCFFVFCFLGFFFGPGDLVNNSFKRRMANLTLPGSSS